MKKWIERVLVLKDNRIEMLMGELQEAEFQYGNNLKAHLIHVEQLIGSNIIYSFSSTVAFTAVTSNACCF